MQTLWAIVVDGAPDRSLAAVMAVNGNPCQRWARCCECYCQRLLGARWLAYCRRCLFQFGIVRWQLVPLIAPWLVVKQQCLWLWGRELHIQMPYTDVWDERLERAITAIAPQWELWSVLDDQVVAPIVRVRVCEGAFFLEVLSYQEPF
jgi:hypothetical protein